MLDTTFLTIARKLDGTIAKSTRFTYHAWPARQDYLVCKKGINFAFRTVITDRGFFAAGVGAQGAPAGDDPFFAQLQIPGSR